MLQELVLVQLVRVLVMGRWVDTKGLKKVYSACILFNLSIFISGKTGSLRDYKWFDVFMRLLREKGGLDLRALLNYVLGKQFFVKTALCCTDRLEASAIQ